jgi:hypothetical protein
MKLFKGIIDIIAKILLPISIIYLGWVQYNTTYDFTKSKTDKELMLKFIEISWNSLNSGDTNAIKNSVRLLQTIDPKYSVQLLDVFSFDTKKTSFIKGELEELKSKAQENIITDMQVVIYYTFYQHDRLAEEIISKLVDETQLDRDNITKRSKIREGLIKCNNEIIYSPDIDFQTIRSLQSFLNDMMSSNKFDLRQQKSMKGNKVLINICE